MSAFTDLAILLDQPIGSLYGYMLDEPGGATSFKNLPNALAIPGYPTTLPLDTINGAVTLGTSPGVVAGHAAAIQDKDTYLARRDFNALFDVPAGPIGNPDRVTWFSFFKPHKLKPGDSQGYSVSQRLGIGGIIVRRTKVEGFIGGLPVLQTADDLIAPDGYYSVFSSWDRLALRWTLHLNGVLAASRDYGATPAAVNWSTGGAAGRLYVGGHTGFGDSGISGAQSFSGVLYNNALGVTGLQGAGLADGEARMRALHLAGLNSPAETAGKMRYVPSWSRLILPANAARKKAWIENDSDTSLYYALNAAAEYGKGLKLMPFGDKWVTPHPKDPEQRVFTGDVYMVHSSPYGLKRALIREET